MTLISFSLFFSSILKMRTSDESLLGRNRKSNCIWNLHEPHREQSCCYYFWDHLVLGSTRDKQAWLESQGYLTCRCSVWLSQGNRPGEVEPADSVFQGLSVQGHCLLPFTLPFNPREATSENPKSYKGSERGHPAHFVFKINRCPLSPEVEGDHLSRGEILTYPLESDGYMQALPLPLHNSEI